MAEIKGPIRKTKFQQNIDIFKCPICDSKMDIRDLKSIVCPNGHCFDISKKGYVNLLQKSTKTKYDKELFKSRNIICKRGFFDPMLDEVGSIIKKGLLGIALKEIKILDAGCGDGFHLGRIVNSLQKRTTLDLFGIGIDISKDGILAASKSYFDIIWCVADLANLPFINKQFDVILNILTPSNYGEFDRTLKDDGLLIKVVPGSGYLKEIRRIFYHETDKQTYSNTEVIELFSNNFDILDTREITYNKVMNKDELYHLIKMTPLSWSATNKKIKQAFDKKLKHITVDFTIIVGQKKMKKQIN